MGARIILMNTEFSGPQIKEVSEREGAQLIICHASGYQTTCPKFAEQENVPVAVIENPTAVTPGLVSDIETQAQEVAYLAGVAAGKMSKDEVIRFFRGHLKG